MTTKRESKETIDEQREESPYKCSICDRVFSDREEFERHQNSMHRENSSRFECLFYSLYTFTHGAITGMRDVIMMKRQEKAANVRHQ